MKYDIPESDKKDRLDDSNFIQAYNNLEKVIGIKLNLNIKNENEIVELLKHPEKFIKDQEIINSIKEVRDIVIEMSDIYYA